MAARPRTRPAIGASCAPRSLNGRAAGSAAEAAGEPGIEREVIPYDVGGRSPNATRPRAGVTYRRRAAHMVSTMLRAVQYLFWRKVPTQGRVGRLTDHPHPLDTRMSQRRVPAVLAALASVLWAACSGHGASPKTNVAPAPEGGGPGPGITAADLRKRLYTFSDDSMLGREAGTLGNVKGTNYIAAEAAKLGLRPAGDSGTFFQTVPLVLHRPDPASKLAANGAPLVLGRDFVVLPSFGGLFGASCDAAGTQAIYAGRLGDANQSLSPDLTAGKIVVFDAPLGAMAGRRDNCAGATPWRGIRMPRPSRSRSSTISQRR